MDHKLKSDSMDKDANEDLVLPHEIQRLRRLEPKRETNEHSTEETNNVNVANQECSESVSSSNQKEILNFEVSHQTSKLKETNESSNLNETCQKIAVDSSHLDEDTICGIGSFRPQLIQKFATSKCFLILYCILGLIQSGYYSLLTTSLTTLEKRFAFSSKTSGTIMMVAESTPLLFGILVGYFGGNLHRPRMLAFGMVTSVLSSFITALPYFIYGSGKHVNALVHQNTTGTEVCDNAVKNMCDIDDRPPTISAVLVLILGSFLKEFGSFTYNVVGIPYMDDNSKKRNTPLYLAFAFALRLFGPTLGYVMSSIFLKINEDPFVDPGYGPDDPRWVGAWWMGFLVQGFLLLIFTLPLLLFPRRLPNQKPLPQSHYGENTNLREKFAGLFLALKRLSKNWVFLMLILKSVTGIFGGFGYYMMLPKYMENRFRLTASEASLYSGPPGLIAVQVATVLGGFIIWKFKPGVKLLTAGLALSEFAGALSFLILMIPQCENVEISNLGLTAEGLILDNQCNQDCLCTTAAFTPVCGPDEQTTYFNPCYAGCMQEITVNETQMFNNCSCVTDNSGNVVNAPSLVKGYCVEENCWSQALAYIIILPTFQGITNLGLVTNTMVFLRSTDPADKSVAMGVYETFISLFGFIPSPIFFGALIDSTCLLWEKSCGQTGNCWFYDVDQLNYKIHGVSALFTTLSGICMVVVYFFSSRLRDMYEDEEDPVSNVSVKNGKMETATSTSVSNAVTEL